MPDRSQYQPIAQVIDDEEADVGEGLQPSSRQELRRSSRPRHIDLSKLDTAFKRWTESIARKVKSKKKAQDNSRKQIWRSVFEPQILSVPGHVGPVKTLDHKPPMTQADFDTLVQGIKRAILDNIHPKMISKGSSGSYFARAKVDGKVQTVGVFKPKDEEPYGRLNPKTTKWLHRQFKWIIPFGRACLIPNLSYISEAAASLLDRRLNLLIVPRTELVSLSSSAFFYDWLDRNAAKKGKPLPDKIGSLQFFLSGFTDASDFLRKNPFPGRAIAETYDENTHRNRSMAKRFLNAVRVLCGRAGDEEDIFDEEEREHERRLFDVSESQSGRPFYWTSALQDSFREELEKLVILDSLMLNTDRGLDNFMIKYCESDHERVLVDVAPSKSSHLEMPQMSELRKSNSTGGGNSIPQGPSMPSSAPYGPRASGTPLPYNRHPHIHIAAIDNSLSFPHEHPRGWRSYTYGWLYLPVSIIGRPFSEKTRNHFLPMLTSKVWWEETSHQLRQLFALDPDFHPKMFNRQLAVIKGQAWNIVQSLKHADEGPLELTRRQKVLVWDDEVEITDQELHEGEESHDHEAIGPASPHASINTVPLPSPSARIGIPRPGGLRTSQSEFPPRRSGDSARVVRPVSFSAKYPRVHPATTGVAILEHMERLDAVEASLKRLPVDESIDEEDEVDVGDSSATPRVRASSQDAAAEEASGSLGRLSPSMVSDALPSVIEVPSSNVSVADEDLVAMSKSMSYMDPSPSTLHTRWMSNDDGRRGLDWIVEGESPKTKTVIVERLETVNAKPVFSC